MPRHSRRHRSRSRSRNLSGGAYSSAATYGEYVNGGVDTQYNRVFDQAGAYGQIPGNVIIGAQGQNLPSTSQIPTQSQMNLIQSAGRKHRKGGFLGEVVNQALVPASILGIQQTYRKKGGKKHRKGGFLGEVVNQAIVPFTLLGMQNTYRNKKNGGRRTRRHRRH
jgi:hypothetical protein